jgi:hypothetical protein
VPSTHATRLGGIHGREAVLKRIDASTNALVNTLNFSSSQLATSSSGTVLAATADNADFQYESNRTLNVYLLPSGSVLNTLNVRMEQ